MGAKKAESDNHHWERGENSLPKGWAGGANKIWWGKTTKGVRREPTFEHICNDITDQGQKKKGAGTSSNKGGDRGLTFREEGLGF